VYTFKILQLQIDTYHLGCVITDHDFARNIIKHLDHPRTRNSSIERCWWASEHQGGGWFFHPLSRYRGYYSAWVAHWTRTPLYPPWRL